MVKQECAATPSPCSSPNSWSPEPAASLLSTPAISPAPPQRQRVRRKRVAIELPSDVALADMDPKDVKRIKNRIAAARLRERSQQQIRDLEAKVEFFELRCEYLETLVAGCANCSGLRELQAAQKIELLPATPLKTETQWTSPVSPLDDELSDEPMDLTELDSALLDDLLNV
ncbi:hypothetical protein BBJ28_00007810 [Nothophytophthora sp. Chile5]|nr:hypothetical protein BBJ28_00007810 [Nothophytophthora sp. Chile5]